MPRRIRNIGGQRIALAAAFSLSLTQTSCTTGPAGTVAPAVVGPPTIVVEGVYPEDLARLVDVAEGTSVWRWRTADAPGARPATLTLAGRHWTWRLEIDTPEAILPERLILEPHEPDIWHGFETPADTNAPGAWFPLPRMALDSPYYHDLLALLQNLITPRFDLQVCHWYIRPVPVGTGPAVSGAVDLGACLEEAVRIWNEAAGMTLFDWAPDTDLGTRLLHLSGHDLRPPMSASLVQRDAQGRALRLQIRVGDTYADPVDERYARRGLLHELAHALLLWGHSLDRDHILWRCGPIVDRPSGDEIRAVRLRQALPAGMDIAGYGRSTELDPPGHECKGASVAELDLSHQPRVGEGPQFGRDGR